MSGHHTPQRVRDFINQDVLGQVPVVGPLVHLRQDQDRVIRTEPGAVTLSHVTVVQQPQDAASAASTSSSAGSAGTGAVKLLLRGVLKARVELLLSVGRLSLTLRGVYEGFVEVSLDCSPMPAKLHAELRLAPTASQPGLSVESRSAYEEANARLLWRTLAFAKDKLLFPPFRGMVKNALLSELQKLHAHDIPCLPPAPTEVTS